MEYFGMNFEVGHAVPEDEIRLIDISKLKERIAIIAEPRPVTLTSEIVGDKLKVTVSQPMMRFLDLQTGKIF